MTVLDRPPAGRYRLRVEDYLRLADSGTFGAARTELIEGDIIVVSPQYLPHGVVKAELYDQLRDGLRAIGSALRVLSEVSLELGPSNMPMPDILLTSDPSGAKAAQLGSVPLVVEVSDTSLDEDLGRKLKLYASAEVPEYWVADVNGRVLHQMWSPAEGTYADRRQIAFGDPIVSGTIPGLAIETGL